MKGLYSVPMTILIVGTRHKTEDKKSSPEIARSQKIENLIKKVAENKTRARFNTRYSNHPQQNLQVIT